MTEIHFYIFFQKIDFLKTETETETETETKPKRKETEKKPATRIEGPKELARIW